ncbi:DUF421 domain-containing protein [Pedobacter terrae]|uniref:DUF421 domain-containing protein n=1 Tax=Pedobacter terrae TaxID=405671 RepID=UPI002FFBBE93
MKKEEIHWGDWHRVLFGNTPAEFLVEVLIRTVIIYLFLLVTLRLMGKRMGGQLTISELAVMLTLGAIVSVPMQIPDKGILQGVLVLFCAFVFQRGITYLSIKKHSIELLTNGKESLLVKNGVIITDQLIKTKISREQMLAILRNNGIYNLGEVQRVYLEACGIFSIFKYKKAKPGLRLTPLSDEVTSMVFDEQKEIRVCKQCGQTAEPGKDVRKACNNCGAQDWGNAVLLLS